MSDTSPNLTLPYIKPSQAQKHVTHNEAILRLDALVQLSVLAIDQIAPPPVPETGIRYIIPENATGAWAGQHAKLAVFQENYWEFYAPKTGWITWVETPREQWVYDGSNWVKVIEPVDFQNLAMLGINTTADSDNRLSVSSPATLLNHEGAGHQLKLNKNANTDTASLLFQTGWSGRAEMGTAGADDFSIKVSSDGVNWNTGLSISGATGNLSVSADMEVSGQITGAAVTQTSQDTTPDRLMKTGDFGLGAQVAPDVSDINLPMASGFYRTLATTIGAFPSGADRHGKLVVSSYDGDNFMQTYQSISQDAVYVRRYQLSSGGFQPWDRLWSRNTTMVDTAGFIKELNQNLVSDLSLWPNGGGTRSLTGDVIQGRDVWRAKSGASPWFGPFEVTVPGIQTGQDYEIRILARSDISSIITLFFAGISFNLNLTTDWQWQTLVLSAASSQIVEVRSVDFILIAAVEVRNV